MTTPPPQVLYQTSGAIATLTLDRPDARNAYSEAMLEQLLAALDRAAADDQVHCALLTGRGKAFHAGGDVKAMQARSGMFAGDPAELRDRYIRGIQAIPRRIAEFRKPLLCAINGARLELALTSPVCATCV